MRIAVKIAGSLRKLILVWLSHKMCETTDGGVSSSHPSCACRGHPSWTCFSLTPDRDPPSSRKGGRADKAAKWTQTLPAWKGHWQISIGRETEEGRLCQSKWLLWIPPLSRVDPWQDAWGALEPGGIAAFSHFTSIAHSWSPLWWFRCVHSLCGEMEYQIPETTESQWHHLTQYHDAPTAQ